MVSKNYEVQNKDKLRLELALDIAELCMYELDIRNMEIIYLENASPIFGASDNIIFRRLQHFNGLTPDQYVEAFANAFIHPDHRYEYKNLLEQLRKGNIFSSETRLLQTNGNYIWTKFTAEPVLENGKVVSIVVAIMNISESKAKLEKLEYTNKLDSFTELYNKTSSIEKINKAIENSHQDDHYAFIMLDINEFKKFNDTYGHDVGDEILKEVAHKLRNTYENEDCVIGRFGGDEFIVLMKQYKDKEDLINKLNRISTYRVKDFSCTASIGVAILNQDANTFSKLFKQADAALYEAKRKGDIITFYSDIAH